MQYLFLLKRVFMDQRGATGATGATDSGEDPSSWCSDICDICDICDILVYGAAYLWINWNTLFLKIWVHRMITREFWDQSQHDALIRY